jgi:CheY-like chemotaxis protein
MAPIANPHGRLILVVDDEPTVLRAVTATLAMAGFRVMVAENGAAGLDAFLAARDEIDLVLTDIVMPVMDGMAMMDQCQELPPQRPRDTHDGIFGACY